MTHYKPPIGWYAVGFDQVLAQYDPLKDAVHGLEYLGPPVPAMVQTVKDMLAEGKVVKILTPRVHVGHTNQIERASKIMQMIADWSKEHIGIPLVATCVIDPFCIEILDTRSRQVYPNKGTILTAGKQPKK